MTGSNRGTGGSIGPPWSVDLLADLHAGALDPARSAQLREQVRRDPAAQAVLRALDDTTGSLRALATTPPAPMPAHFAARLDAAIEAESRSMRTSGSTRELPRITDTQQFPAATDDDYDGPGGADGVVVDLAQARRRRNRRLGIAGGLVAAAAAVAAVTIAVLPGSGGNGGTGGGVAAPPASGGASAPLQVRSDNMAAALGQTQHRHDLGPLQDEATLQGCLRANGVPNPAQPPVGVRPVTLDGRSAVLIVLTTGKPAQFRLLFVGDSCADGNPATIADPVIGGVPTTR